MRQNTNTVLSSKMETFHPRIHKFYKENPNIDFETVNLQCIDLFEKSLLQAQKITTSKDTADLLQKPSEMTTIKRNYIQTMESLFSTKTITATGAISVHAQLIASGRIVGG